jgi:predicted O-methyltransferase YrrM
MDIDIISHSEAADKAWGSLYYHVIPSLIKKFELKKIAEVGVAFGGHLENILKNTELEKAYAIDPYILFESSTDSFSYAQENYKQKDYDNLFFFVVERFRKYEKRVEIMRETSLNAAEKIEDEFLDIVFIDAEHTYKGVREDISLWENKVRSGGVISGHDYDHPNFPEVKIAVDEWCSKGDYLLNLENGYVWWVTKN